MCRAQAGESLLTKGGGGGGGDAGTWEPLANPPSARHGTFAEQGPPTLKACNRQQTQQRSSLQRAHHRRRRVRRCPRWRSGGRGEQRGGKTRREREAVCRRAEPYRQEDGFIPPVRFRGVVFTWDGCPLQYSSLCAVSALKCPARLARYYTCGQQRAPMNKTCENKCKENWVFKYSSQF